MGTPGYFLILPRYVTSEFGLDIAYLSGYYTRQMITRQMMIIAGGEPELCRRRHAISERVGSMHPCMHYVSVSLVQNAVCTCCAYVGKCEKGFV